MSRIGSGGNFEQRGIDPAAVVNVIKGWSSEEPWKV